MEDAPSSGAPGLPRSSTSKELRSLPVTVGPPPIPIDPPINNGWMLCMAFSTTSVIIEVILGIILDNTSCVMRSMSMVGVGRFGSR